MARAYPKKVSKIKFFCKPPWHQSRPCPPLSFHLGSFFFLGTLVQGSSCFFGLDNLFAEKKMKLAQLNLSQELTEPLGLQPVKMDRLGPLVVLAGENGAGKSRLLGLVKKRKGFKSFSEFVTRQIQMEGLKNSVQQIQLQLKKGLSPTHRLQLEQNEKHQQREMVQIQLLLEGMSDFAGELSAENWPQLIEFVPKKPISSPSLSNDNRTIWLQRTIHQGIDSYAQTTLEIIRLALQQRASSTSEDKKTFQVTEAEKTQAEQNWEKLGALVESLLDTVLTANKDQEASLFGRPIGGAHELSDGQKVLLQFCASLYMQEVDLDQAIILMDEPENHLHPAALLQVIDRVRAAIPNGQLWIATHSVHILAHLYQLDSNCLWFMDQGKVEWAGRIPEKVLGTLLGKPEERERLSDFLGLPAQLGSLSFAAESLFPPETVGYLPGDPQTQQIHEALSQIRQEGQKVRLLDLGAGKGRLLAALRDLSPEGESLADWLDYFAYDQKEEVECKQEIVRLYGDGTNRYFQKYTDLKSRREDTFDLVLMCNVLHEVEPKDWNNLLGDGSLFYTLLKDTGHLCIVEDQLLQRGEKAHQNGFLVLDQPQFRELFSLTPENYLERSQKEGRLKAHFFPRSCLANYSAETRKQAIKLLKESALEELKKLRIGTDDSQSGRLHGFWSQQFANASLALEQL